VSDHTWPRSASELSRRLAADLRAAGWVIAHLPRVATSLQMLFDMVRQGGSTIAVPADRPVIRTLIQLDGDIVTSADFELVRHWSPLEREQLLRQHQATLQARLQAVDPRFGAGVASFISLFRSASVAAPVVTGGVSVVGGAATTSWLLASFIPLGVRLAAAPLLRLALGAGRLYLHRRLRG